MTPEEKFQAIIDAEDKIEPTDWMPEAYRKTLIRQGDLANQRLPVCLRHPVRRLDLVLGVNNRLKLLFGCHNPTVANERSFANRFSKAQAITCDSWGTGKVSVFRRERPGRGD